MQIPSKTFLWGDYAALLGADAGIVTTKPCFVFSQQEILDSKTSQVLSYKFEINPQSPAGLLIKSFQSRSDLLQNHTDLSEISKDFWDSLQTCHLWDPYNGGGGFGRSTAEFIYVLSRLEKHLEISPKKGWQIYKKLTSQQNYSPSGYDLLAQMQGGLNLLSFVNDNLDIQKKSWPFSQESFLIFKTKLKVPTHEHLKGLDFKTLKPLCLLSPQITTAFLRLDLEGFLEGLRDYNHELKVLDLVCTESLALIKELESWAEVDLVRGCGALGADVIAVFCKKQYKESLRDKVQEALAHHLDFICDESQIFESL